MSILSSFATFCRLLQWVNIVMNNYYHFHTPQLVLGGAWCWWRGRWTSWRLWGRRLLQAEAALSWSLVTSQVGGWWIVLALSLELVMFRRARGDEVAGAGGGPLPWRGGLCGQQCGLCAPAAQVKPGHWYTCHLRVWSRPVTSVPQPLCWQAVMWCEEKLYFSFVDGDIEEWKRCVGVNVWGALHVTRWISIPIKNWKGF